MNRPLLLTAICTALAACASNPGKPYQAPAAGPVAELSFRNATPGRAEVVVYEDGARCSGRRALPALLVDEEATVPVAAGDTLAFSFQYRLPNTTPPRHCAVTASFTPRAGHRYQAALRPSGDSCSVDLTGQSQDNGGQWQRSGVPDARLRAPLKGKDDAGPHCLP